MFICLNELVFYWRCLPDENTWRCAILTKQWGLFIARRDVRCVDTATISVEECVQRTVRIGEIGEECVEYMSENVRMH